MPEVTDRDRGIAMILRRTGERQRHRRHVRRLRLLISAAEGTAGFTLDALERIHIAEKTERLSRASCQTWRN